MLDGRCWEMLPVLQGAVISRGSLEPEVVLTDDGRYVTLVSGAFSARVRKAAGRAGKVHVKGHGRTDRVPVAELQVTPAGPPREVIVDFIIRFLKQRRYQVDRVERSTPSERLLHVDGRELHLVIEDKRKHWEVRLMDADPARPFLCARRHQLVFLLSKSLRLRRAHDGVYEVDYDALPIQAHSEEALAVKYPGLWQRLSNLVFYGRSENLRLFYGEEGRIPAIRRALSLSWKSSLSNGIITMTAAGRVTRRLKEFSFYASASGIFAGIAAIISEIRYQKRGLRVAEHMPDSRHAAISRQEKYRRVYEFRGVRSWRNLERALSSLTDRKTLADYHEAKRRIYELVEQGRHGEIAQVLDLVARVPPKHHDLIRNLVDSLRPIEFDQVIEADLERIRELAQATDEGGEPLRLLSQEALPRLERYLREMYPRRLKETFYMEANKELSFEVKHAVRRPLESEIAGVLKGGRRYLVPGIWRAFSCYWMTYLSGIAATYGDEVTGADIPAEVFLAYYLGFGAYMSYTSYGLMRISSVVDLQGIIKELERDPRVNAMDVWNQYVSHLNKVSLAFTSTGMLLGLLVLLVSGWASSAYRRRTGNELSPGLSAAPLFAIELPAVALRCWAQYDWLRCIRELSELYD